MSSSAGMVDGLALHDTVASSPDETTWVGAVTAKKVGWEAEGGERGQNGIRRVKTGDDRNNAAVPLLHVVVTSSSHCCDRKGWQRKAYTNICKTGSTYPSRSVKGRTKSSKMDSITPTPTTEKLAAFTLAVVSKAALQQ